MFDSPAADRIESVRTTLAGLARDFEPAMLSGPQAVGMVTDLGAVRCLTDGLLAKAARRVEETAAHIWGDDRDAASLTAKAMGCSNGEARAMIGTAAKLENFAATDAAVRAGRLSTRQAKLIADAAGVNPGAEAELIAAAAGGLVPLNDACIKARAAVETQADRARRQHRSRSLHLWVDGDGMVGGRFSLAPEVGGPVKALIDGLAGRIFRRHRRSRDHEPMNAYAADGLAEALLGEAVVAAAVPESTEATGTAADDTTDAADATGDVTDAIRAADGGDDAGAGEQRDLEGAGLEDVGAGGPDVANAEPAVKVGVTFTVHVLIDHGALLRGEVRDGEVCEIAGVGPVNVAWVRSLLGSAFLTAVIKRGKDIATVAHLGRHVPAELRTALTVAGRECDVAGCHHRGYLEIDHSEVDYAKGGPTAWWNLTWFCSVHHKRKSAGATLGPPDPITRKRRLVDPREPPAPPDQKSRAA